MRPSVPCTWPQTDLCGVGALGIQDPSRSILPPSSLSEEERRVKDTKRETQPGKWKFRFSLLSGGGQFFAKLEIKNTHERSGAMGGLAEPSR